MLKISENFQIENKNAILKCKALMKYQGNSEQDYQGWKVNLGKIQYKR